MHRKASIEDNMRKKKITSIIMLAVAGIVWGSSFVVVKDSMNYMDPLWQLATRLSVACSVVLFLLFPRLKKINRETLKHGLILGSIFFLALLFQNIGCNYTTASKCSFLTVSYVAFVPIIEFFVLRHGMTGKKIAAVILCLTGVGLLTLQGNLRLGKGDTLVIICGICYAMHIIYIDRCGEKINVVDLHFLQIVTATILAIFTAFMFEPFPTEISIHCGLGLIYCGLFEILLGFFLQIKGQQNTNPALAGILLSMESVYACIFAAIFLKETFTAKMIVGCILIFVAAILEGMEGQK